MCVSQRVKPAQADGDCVGVTSDSNIALLGHIRLFLTASPPLSSRHVRRDSSKFHAPPTDPLRGFIML